MNRNPFLRPLLLAIASFLFLTGCRGIAALDPSAPPSPDVPADPVEALLTRLSPAEKVGQMMMVGLMTNTYDENCAYLQNEFSIGNFILFDRNGNTAEDVRALTAALRKGSPTAVPLLIALDEEGGAVSRFTDFLPPPPAAKLLGEAGDSAAAKRYAAETAQALRALGINWNLAPVADLGLSDGRSYGDDPAIVTAFLQSAAAGYREENCPFCLKHFPGIGKGEADTHDGDVAITASIEELRREDMAPFAALIAHTPHTAFAVMVGHVRCDAIECVPASLSPAVVTDLLRGELHYDGVVVTDDLTMGAIAAHYTPEEAALRAIHAGCDLLLIGHGYEAETAAYNAILRAVNTGDLPMERIDTSVRRILRMKLAHEAAEKG